MAAVRNLADHNHPATTDTLSKLKTNVLPLCTYNLCLMFTVVCVHSLRCGCIHSTMIVVLCFYYLPRWYSYDLCGVIADLDGTIGYRW